MTDLPAEVATGLVVGRFRVPSVDGADAGLDPDATPATGRIRFDAIAPHRRVQLPEAEIFGGFSGIFELDADGYLVDKAGEPGVLLPTGAYSVRFNIKKMRLNPMTIVVTEAHTAEEPLDLGLLILSGPVLVGAPTFTPDTLILDGGTP